MSEMRAIVPTNLVYKAEEFEKISYGHMPSGMDDKWFIFLENRTLYFHRSWTGNCIYQVAFVPTDRGYEATEFCVTRNPGEYKGTDDKYDVQLLFFLIDNFLLGKAVPFPVSGKDVESDGRGALQHNFAGTGFTEMPFETD
jgi:hypothetical protein